MSEENVSRISRPIAVFDFFELVLEQAVTIVLSGKDSIKPLTEQRITTYLTQFLQTNNISLQEECRAVENMLDSLLDESFDQLANNVFDKDELFSIEVFKNHFISEAKSILAQLKEFDTDKPIEHNKDNFKAYLMLRLFHEIYRTMVVMVNGADSLRLYLSKIRFLNALNIPTTIEEYSDLYNRHHVLVAVEKGIARLGLNEAVDLDDVSKYYVHFPITSHIYSEIKQLADTGLPLSGIEKEIKKILGKYRSFEVIEIFTHTAYIMDLISLISKNDFYRNGFKEILQEWQKLISVKKKMLNEFIAETLAELKAKNMGMSESIFNITTFMVSMIADNMDEKEISASIGRIFVSMYDNLVKDYHIETNEKMRQLREVLETKDQYCSIEKIQDIKKQYSELANKKIDIQKLFSENFFQISPINYIFLVYLAFKKNDIAFFQNLLIKSPNENRLLRNYAKDMIYKRIEINSTTTNPDKEEKVKSIYRDYFSVISNDKEKLDYRKETLLTLIYLVSQTQPSPYKTFYSEMTDVLLSELSKVLNVNLFHKRSSGKNLKSNEEDNIRLASYIIEENIYKFLMQMLEKGGAAKEPIKRKIELRFSNEYKNIVDKYHRMEMKLV